MWHDGDPVWLCACGQMCECPPCVLGLAPRVLDGKPRRARRIAMRHRGGVRVQQGHGETEQAGGEACACV